MISRITPLVLALAACNSTGSPAKDAARDRGDAAAPAPSAGSAACASDADCRTWSSYCGEAPCACRVVAKGEPDPTCSAPGRVMCFVDPCAGKAAACQAAHCVLVLAQPQPSPSSSM